MQSDVNKRAEAGELALQQNRKTGEAQVNPFPQQRSDRGARRAQAMVEFALALPIFLLMVYGLLEVGRLLFMEATVTTATREAVRYASAWGRIGTSGYQQYQDCAGIRSAATNAGFLLNLSGTTNADIHIYLDDETTPTQAQYEYCTTSGLAVDTNVGSSAHPVNPGDRVVVTINRSYSPILPLFLPLTGRTLTSTARRTLMGIIDLATPTP